jgi:hypothetical protein
MSDEDALMTTIVDRDAAAIRRQIIQREFILINVSDGEDDDDDGEEMGALTAEIDDFDVLVVFTSEEHAGRFVEGMGELFEEEDEVTGFVVDGNALLEYLPESYGLLINAESDGAQVIDPLLLGEVLGITD